jgi:hypothetical protein
VLLIIGLIIGGITAGSSLIQQAKIKAVIQEKNQFITAINTFRVQFNAYPGDITNASAFWPSCDTPATNCNGNGDGMIEWYNGVGREGLRAWQQLSTLGIIPGNYNGQPTDVNNGATPNVNTPASKYGSNTGWFISHTSETAGFQANWTNYNNSPSNFLGFGGYNYNNATDNYAIKVLDAYNIDAKIDDGVPITGRVYGADIVFCSSAGLYQLTNGAAACAMLFLF